MARFMMTPALSAGWPATRRPASRISWDIMGFRGPSRKALGFGTRPRDLGAAFIQQRLGLRNGSSSAGPAPKALACGFAAAVGARSLFPFGSTARDEAQADSDVDAFVESDPKSHSSLIDLAGIKLALEDQIGREVHITTRDSLHPLMPKGIEADSIKVF